MLRDPAASGSIMQVRRFIGINTQATPHGDAGMIKRARGASSPVRFSKWAGNTIRQNRQLFTVARTGPGFAGALIAILSKEGVF